jgi:hypothetical protein
MFYIERLWRNRHSFNVSSFSIHTHIPLTLYPRGIEVYQIFLRDTHVLPKLVSYEEHCRCDGGKPIAVFLQSISGEIAINPIVAFYDIHG